MHHDDDDLWWLMMLWPTGGRGWFGLIMTAIGLGICVYYLITQVTP